jgi:peptide/nickel transport system substrate-binding protein
MSVANRSRSAPVHHRAQVTAKLLSVLVVLSLLLAACAAPGAPAAPAAGGESAAPAAGGESAAAPAVTLPADAAPEQVLRIATGSSGSASFTFTPMGGGGDQQSWQPLVWMPPMYFDEAFQDLKPGIFAEWKPNEDFTEWVFSIDTRAQWSDGTPVTAADVKGTWEIMADPLTEHGRITGYIGKVEGFQDVFEQKTTDMTGLTVVDDATFKVKLIAADPLFHYRIATTHMNPVKAEQARDNVHDFWKPENSPAVSGPYMLESYNPDLGEATMVPNPNWWGDEGPYLSQITFQFIPEAETVATMMLNDQIDTTIAGVSASIKEQLPDVFRPTKSIGFNNFWLRPSAEPTDDVNVRKALILAVDFEAVFKAAFPEGDASMVYQMIDTDLPCNQADASWYQYDPEAAKAALAESKYGSAENLPKIRVSPRGDWPPMNRALEAVVEFWRQNLGITNVEFKVRPDEFGEDEAKLNLLRDDVVVRFPDSAQYMWVAAHSAGPIVSGGAEKAIMAGYKNAEIEALIEQAQGTPVDDPQRCELTLEAQRKFMDDYMVLFFGNPDSARVVREYVKNLISGPDVGLIEPWKIYIAAH